MDYSSYSLFRPYRMPVTKHGTLGIPLAGGGNLIYQMRKIELSISSITQPKIQQISWDLKVRVQRFFPTILSCFPRWKEKSGKE